MTAGAPAPAAVYAIPAGVSFVDALARGLLERAAGDPATVARSRVLLPTRRACRALQDAFLRATEGRPLLLPQMTPLADIDGDVLEMESAADGALADALDLRPAMPPMTRQLLLARLVLELEGATSGSPGPLERAAGLAAELGRLLDQAAIQDVPLSRLRTLVRDDYARHWQVTLDFLSIVLEAWPRILAERDMIDAVPRRLALIRAQAEAWRRRPPATPVTVAGSTGSIPATAELIATVARLPAGAVVLAGLDRGLDDESWRGLPASHPQYGLQQLLGRIGIARDAVRPWPAPGGVAVPAAAARAALLSQALRPAETSHRPADHPARDADAALGGLSRIEAESPREEAAAVAVMLRGVLETPGRTAALVTPDRGLARRVAAELGRWGVVIDDSGGTPLAHTPAGAFLCLTATMVAAQLAPVPLLAALKHPLAAGRRAPGRFRSLVRRLETAVLRGPRPGPGLGGLRRALSEAHVGARPALAGLLDDLETAIAPLVALFQAPAAPLSDLVAAHVALAEALAASDAEAGPARLWAGDSGDATARFVHELATAAEALPRVAPAGYPALLGTLLSGRVARPRWGAHPRLAILGTLEARLQLADVMILAGLNEGTWPAEPPPDPWMSRPMRADFGLAPPERMIGLSADDFCQAAAAAEVVLSRATRIAGTPTVPARWLRRLDATIAAEGRVLPEAAVDPVALARRLDEPAALVPAEPPAPRPPLAARPRRLSVTEIETWQRDPYAIYARHVLGLTPLLPIDADPERADFGTIVHEALERFVRETPAGPAEAALERLLAIGRDTFGETLDRPSVWAFWWPRFERAAAWLVRQEAARAAEVAERNVECSGAVSIDGPAGPFELRGRADRIDRAIDGTLTVIDYKTGTVPRAEDMRQGLSPQLALEGWMAEQGAFAAVAPATVAALEHWKLSGRGDGGSRIAFSGDVAETVAAAGAGVARLIAAFDDPARPYPACPDPRLAPRYNDYAHLERLAEWRSAGDEP